MEGETVKWQPALSGTSLKKQRKGRVSPLVHRWLRVGAIAGGLDPGADGSQGLMKQVARSSLWRGRWGQPCGPRRPHRRALEPNISFSPQEEVTLWCTIQNPPLLFLTGFDPLSQQVHTLAVLPTPPRRCCTLPCSSRLAQPPRSQPGLLPGDSQAALPHPLPYPDIHLPLRCNFSTSPSGGSLSRGATHPCFLFGPQNACDALLVEVPSMFWTNEQRPQIMWIESGPYSLDR